MCLRQVVETWGESMTYSSRELPLSELLERIVAQCENERHLHEEPLTSESHENGDVMVVWISDGKAFLTYLVLVETSSTLIFVQLEADGLPSGKPDELARQRSNIEELCAMAGGWAVPWILRTAACEFTAISADKRRDYSGWGNPALFFFGGRNLAWTVY